MKKTNKNKIEEFIRVDHAGERGAIKIYEGQLLALNTFVKDDDLKKKIDTSAINTDGKKSFAVKQKEPFRSNKNPNRPNQTHTPTKSFDPKKKNFARKFVEQQATKAFIKKDDKPTGKSKLKLKGPIDKRDFKLTISRALNVEEIEIKQRSLASVKRARLKEKKKQS